jgi:hypothetical protein
VNKKKQKTCGHFEYYTKRKKHEYLATVFIEAYTYTFNRDGLTINEQYWQNNTIFEVPPSEK